MGDWFQRVVDREASLSEAEQLAPKILEWLTDREIIESDLRDCGLGKDGLAHPPGTNYWMAIDHPNHNLLNSRINGVQIIVGRTVFDCGQGGFNLTCPQCQNHIVWTDAITSTWQNAVDGWYHESGQGLLRCPCCDRATSVVDWHYSPAFGFGNFGLEFWNWDPLSATFLAEIDRQLDHRTLYVAGKL